MTIPEHILNRAIEVIGDQNGATLWLNRPNRSLGGATPISLLETEEGKQLVLDTLGRIEYGSCA